MTWHFQFWIRKNKAEGRHEYEGRTWTYSSARALAVQFTFWTPAKIHRILASLVQQGVIRLGNFNQIGYDRTAWYAFENEEAFLNLHFPKMENASSKSAKSILQNPKMDVPNLQNGFSSFETAIQDGFTDSSQIAGKDLPAPPASQSARADPAAEIFKARCLEFTGAPYVIGKGDMVQLAGLRKAWTIGTRDTPPGWDDAVQNYFGSPLAKYSLADIVCRYSVFKNSKLDVYNKPVSHMAAHRRDPNQELADKIKAGMHDRQTGSGTDLARREQTGGSE